MKPMHLAVLGAVLAVGAVLYMLLGDSSDRHEDRRGTDRPTAVTPAGSGADEESQTPDAGKLSFTLKVLQPDGAPAAGATIELAGSATERATAGRDGVVKIDGLSPGLYNLIARKERATGAMDFELDKTETDLGTLTLAQSVAIRGHVFDSSGEPIENARVEAVRIAASRSFDMTTIVTVLMTPEQVVAHTTTNADGVYELLVPTGGTYGLRAMAKGFAQEGEGGRLYAADAEGVDFYLFPGVQVSGRVVDAHGTAIAGARVMIIDPMSAFGKRIPKVEATTGGDGRFELLASPSNQMLLVVRAVGFATHMQSNLVLPALDLTITLEEGISVRLHAVDAAQPLMPAPHVNAAIMYRGGFAAGKTDEQGDLLLENLPTKGSRMWGGQQQAILWGGGFVANMVNLGSVEPQDGVVDIGNVEMSKGGIVRGKVLDKATGEPVAEAGLRSFGGLDMQLEFMGSTRGVSGADGKYEMTGVPLKAHTIIANHPDYVGNFDMMAMVQMRQGGGKPLFPEGETELEHNIELTPAVSVTGVVFAPDGSPAAGAKVESRDPMAMMRMMFGGGQNSAITDAEGRFTLGGLKEGQSIQLSAKHREYGSSDTKSAKPDEPLTLRLTEPLMIKGVVVDEKGEPVAGVKVTVKRPQQRQGRGPRVVVTGNQDEGDARPAVTDKEGAYVVRNAPPGALTVNFEHNEYMPVKTPLNVAPGTPETEMAQTVLMRGLGIEGTVVGPDGKPAGGVPINANWDYQGGQSTPSADGQGRTNGNTQTDEEGHFSIYGLREGKYRLRTWQQNVYSTRPVVSTGTMDAQVELREAGQLRGKVTANGIPVAGAAIRANRVTTRPDGQTSQDFIAWANTAGDGTFTLTPLPPDEAFQLSITHDGHKELKIDGVRAVDGEQPYVLETGNVVAGVVVDPDGNGVAGVRIQVQVNGEYKKQVQTGTDGTFAAGGLDDGEITLKLASWGQNYIAPEPVVATPGDRNIRIVAELGESISGTVYFADGKPATQVSIQAIDENGKTVGNTWVWQDDGNFELTGLRKGRYALRVQRVIQGATEQPAPTETDPIATGSTGIEIHLNE